jgi:serine phosphatase RsbU (regulator of sigma subunit)
MHPILGHNRRIRLYLALWLPAGLALAALLQLNSAITWPQALALGVPLALFDGVLCLAAWYPAKSIALRSGRIGQILVSHAGGAALTTALWHLAGTLWAHLLEHLGIDGAVAAYQPQTPLIFALGLLLYSLATSACYLYLAFEASHHAERRAFEARREQELSTQELELARALQQRLLPPSELERPGFALAARNLAARGVAGDFYDYFESADGTLHFAVADVAGKGMAASLIMATVKALLPWVAAGRPVDAALDELNRRLADLLGPREFVALALAAYQPATGRLELSNAGLPDPYLLRGSAPVEVRAVEAPLPRLPLGRLRHHAYRRLILELAPGDRLLMLTDGLPEAPMAVDEPLGYERLVGFLDHAAATPAAFLDVLHRRLRAVVLSDQDDDWTTLLLERKPVASAS